VNEVLSDTRTERKDNFVLDMSFGYQDTDPSL